MSSYPNIKTQYQAFVSTPDLFVDDAVTGYPPFVTSPISLPNHISASQKVFGKRAEEYLASYITQHPDYAPLAHGLQIIDHKITIGELDFLLYDKVDKTTKHIELVSKLYVYDPSFTKEMDRWIGPNRKR